MSQIIFKRHNIKKYFVLLQHQYIMTMKKILCLLATSIVLLTACSDSSNESTTPAKRTVIVYMAAENTLSGNAQDDINEMIQGVKKIAKYDNLIVFVDRARSQETPFIIRLRDNEKQPADTIYKYPSDFLTLTLIT